MAGRAAIDAGVRADRGRPGRAHGDVHAWVLYDIPPEVRELPENIPPDPTAPFGSRQGTNSFGRLGYDGPCPPNGPFHRYRFTLYALNHPTGLRPGAQKEDVLAAIQERQIDKAELRGRYQRVGFGTFVRALIHH